MPSFDVVSEVDMHELTNAVDQTMREITNRFDFKGVDARVEQNKEEVLLSADSDFRIQQMRDIFHSKLVKRGIELDSLDEGEVETTISNARQTIRIKQGLDKDTARKIIKLVKDSKIKVQASVQADQVRINGKKRDDLQQVIAMLKEAEVGIPLQFKNFRD
jgi:uncharacterized protein YajQ (UPF0234 family)